MYVCNFTRQFSSVDITKYAMFNYLLPHYVLLIHEQNWINDNYSK